MKNFKISSVELLGLLFCKCLYNPVGAQPPPSTLCHYISSKLSRYIFKSRNYQISATRDLKKLLRRLLYSWITFSLRNRTGRDCWWSWRRFDHWTQTWSREQRLRGSCSKSEDGAPSEWSLPTAWHPPGYRKQQSLLR